MAIFLNSDRKIKSIWWVLIFFLFLSALLFPLIILADRCSFEVTMTHQVIMIMVVSVICQLLRRKPMGELTGSMNLVWVKELIAGLSIGALLMVLPVLPLTVLGYVHWQTDAFSCSTIQSGLLLFLSAAIAEELLFRGFVFQRLIQAVGNWPAQFIIASFFLLTHIDNPGMTGTVKIMASLNIFIASFLFGIAYIKTKSLAMPLGLHFMANFMQGTVLGFGVSGGKDPGLFKPVFADAPVWLSGGDFGMEASIGGLFFVTLITVSFYYCYPTKK